MTVMRIRLRLAVAVLGVFVVLGAMAGMAAASPTAAEPHQTTSCTWTRIGATTRGAFFPASAMTTVTNTMFLYGGLSQSNQAENMLNTIDFTNPGIGNAVHGSVTVGAAQRYFGAAAAFREANNTVYFIGGAEQTGRGRDRVQAFDMNSRTWIGTVNVSGALQDRVFHAAGYAPDHDAIIVVGGASTCDAAEFDPSGTPPDTCDAANSPKVAIVFSDTGAASIVNLPTGGPRQVLGHSMVYDSTAKRMLVFGGANRAAGPGSTDLWQLDLSGADLSSAAWSRLTASGSVTGRFLHSAVYDPDRNWMIIHGGVRQNAFLTNESSLADTFALDLSASPPVWSNLRADEQGSAVGSVMAYDTVNDAVILSQGRRQFRAGSSQNVATNSYHLDCQAVVPTPTRDTPPTQPVTPGTPGTGATATPTPPIVPGQGEPCDFITSGRVPNAVINAAVANPADVNGWGQLCFPNRPIGPFNLFREKLSLRNIAAPYHPLYNGVVFKCGCP